MSVKNSVDKWKSALFKLPNSMFFEIVKNYLGPLKTPFNKHSLIKTLSEFLRSEETKRRVIALIDPQDRELLSIIMTLESVTMDDLLSFYEGRRQYLDIHHHLLNLEERLLIYRSPDFQETRIHANPLLADRLYEEIGDYAFISREPVPDGTPASLPWLSDQMLTALFSFITAFPALLRSNGSLRKKAEKELAARVPTMLENTTFGLRIHVVIGLLEQCGLAESDETIVRTPYGTWKKFGELSVETRFMYLWAKCIELFASKPDRPIPVDRAHSFLALFFDSFPSSIQLNENDTVKLIKLFLIKSGLPQKACLDIISVLKLLFLIVPVGLDSADRHSTARETTPDNSEAAPLSWRRNPYTPGAETDSGYSRHRDEAYLIVQPNFFVTIKPWVPLEEALPAALIAEISRYDIYPRYEITKESFMHGLENGLSADETVTFLEKRSAGPLPQNLTFSLEHWENEFKSAVLYEGFVLTVKNEQRMIIERSKALHPFIKARLAPGVYLLSRNEKEAWRKALDEIGVSFIHPDRSSPTKEDRSEKYEFQTFAETLSETASQPLLPFQEGDDRFLKLPPRKEPQKDNLIKELTGKLESSKLSKGAYEEYSARIKKKLVLYPEQIRELPKAGHKDEAKGIDFMGKVRLLEAGLQNGNTLLEIVERTDRGKPRRVVIKPVTLDKTGGELRLTGTAVPEGTELTMRVDKMSLVRRVKGPLLG